MGTALLALTIVVYLACWIVGSVLYKQGLHSRCQFMIWESFFSITILVLLIASFGVLFLIKHPEKTGRVITPLNVLLAGVVLMIFVSLLPVFSEKNNIGFYSIMLALHNTFRVFTLDVELGDVLNNTNCPPYYSVLLSFELVMAPLLTVSFLVSFFKDISSYILLFFNMNSEVSVFTELNERSLALGRSIKENNRKALIVYTDVDSGELSECEDLIDEARKFQAVCFKRDVKSVRFGLCRSDLCFFVMGNNEEQIIDCSISLIDRYKYRGSKRKTALYAFVMGKEAELVFDSIECDSIKLRRINEVRSNIYRFLFDNGISLFKEAVSINEDNKKQINVVILGLGIHGSEMLKALSWYCQMDGYHLTIDAYDIDEHIEDRLKAEMPELLSAGFNNVFIPGEAEYTINIHSGIDVTTERFNIDFQQKKHTTFVFVSLGSDERNVHIAANIRMLCERMRIKPSIYSIVLSSLVSKKLENICNFKDEPYDINYIGDISSSYSSEVIINSELEELCVATYRVSEEDSEEKKRDKKKREDDFWKYEYNYRSKLALLIHSKARIECGIKGAEKAPSDRTEEEKSIIELLEKRRWNAYTRSIGYVYSESRNDLGKMHNRLVSYYEITDDKVREEDNKV